MNKHLIINTVHLFVMYAVALLLIGVGTSTLIDNYNRDIIHTDQITGVIKQTQVITAKKRAGVPATPRLKLDFLQITLADTALKLYSYNAKQEYSELQKQLISGTPVKVNFKKLAPHIIENNIYQLAIDDHSILTHQNFKQKEYFAGSIMLVLGIVMCLIYTLLLKAKGLKQKW